MTPDTPQQFVGQDVPGLVTGRRYANAPITQALLEFRLEGADVNLVAQLDDLDFDGDFRPAEPVFHFQGEIELGNDGSWTQDARSNQIGFRYVREDDCRIIQVATDRFTYIWLGAYESWDQFVGEAEAAWLALKDRLGPVTLSVVSVRFTNEIVLPLHSVELKDYLRVAVDVPAYLPQSITRMFLQFDVPLPDLAAVATITSSLLDPTPDREGGGLLLDTDVRSDLGVSTGLPEFNDSLRGTLGRLRIAKNYVFEACITDATRGLIE